MFWGLCLIWGNSSIKGIICQVYVLCIFWFELLQYYYAFIWLAWVPEMFLDWAKNMNLLKTSQNSKRLHIPSCSLIVSQISAFSSEQYAMEPQCLVSGECLMTKSWFLCFWMHFFWLFVLLATDSLECYNSVEYTEALALCSVCSHEVTWTLHSASFFWWLCAEGEGN